MCKREKKTGDKTPEKCSFKENRVKGKLEDMRSFFRRGNRTVY
jgi:hypothetical protein